MPSKRLADHATNKYRNANGEN
ncbi:hypothetical protein SPHINGOT1_80075 [Sphingomonas sp. T1]|nr:hypothetical protein SPHINGOT1_80075 [Sphingomonas sp. T1]